jgi:hypothetical protein
MTNYVTDPIPVFPTEGAIDLKTRTPMAKAIAWAMEQTIADPTSLQSCAPTIPPDIAREIITRMIEDRLDEYANGIEYAAMEASCYEAEPMGVLALWHGTHYAIAITNEVPAGYLVENRCDCQQQHRTAEQN